MPALRELSRREVEAMIEERTARPENPQFGASFKDFPEIDADPPAPDKGMRMWVIADNGSGKRALRARFPTGAVQTLSTEP